VTWFSTNDFLFDLPGDGWVEETIHVFYAKEDDRTGFVITRVSPVKGADNSLEASIAALPKGLYDEKEIVRSEYRDFGAVDGQDVSFFARRGMDGSYFRIVSVPYYGRELSFQWMGPAGTREQVDERAERTLESLRFWSRQ
jgi:hypothetical protein